MADVFHLHRCIAKISKLNMLWTGVESAINGDDSGNDAGRGGCRAPGEKKKQNPGVKRKKKDVDSGSQGVKRKRKKCQSTIEEPLVPLFCVYFIRPDMVFYK